MAFLDINDGVVILDEDRNIAKIVDVMEIPELDVDNNINDERTYVIYSVAEDLPTAMVRAKRHKEEFVEMYTDYKLLDSIAISLPDDRFSSAMCDDDQCCPPEGQKADENKESFLIVDHADKPAKECYDEFIEKLEGEATFDDTLLHDLNVRDAAISVLTNENKWDLVLVAKPTNDNSECWKTFYACALLFSDEDNPELFAQTVLDEVTDYPLGLLIKKSLKTLDPKTSFEFIVSAFSKFDTDYLLDLSNR